MGRGKSNQPEQVVKLLRQVEVAVANGKTTAQARRHFRVVARWFTDLLSLPEAGLDIEDYTWHNDRHTFCSWLAIGGAPFKTIQDLAGHRTIAMTARYSHLSPDHKRNEIAKLSANPKVLHFETARATGTANA